MRTTPLAPSHLSRSSPRPRRPGRLLLAALTLAALALAAGAGVAAAGPGSPPQKVTDIAALTAGVDPLVRASGFGTGAFFPLGVLGVPVAGGLDVDGDGHGDYAVAHMVASPLGRFIAGEVDLVFGDGTLSDAFDLGVPHPRVLHIQGAGNLGVAEMTGSEIWMGDVTGDGLADLVVCAQNHSFIGGGGPRFGAGAVLVVEGGPALSALATSLTPLDLAAPPPGVTIFTLLGAQPFGRLGIWARVGDVDGDGIDDLLAAADQESTGADIHHGAVYVVRGGAHLAQNAVVDLAAFGSTLLAGSIARVVPPPGSFEFHLGATSNLGDLDGNGRAEVLLGAALNRAGAFLGPFGPDPSTTHAVGGPPGGRFFALWDDAFPAGPWPAGFQIQLGADPQVLTVIRGGVENAAFGEEILGGADYDGDGRPELFLGDLTGDGSADQSRPQSGVGYVLYRAERLRGEDFVIDDPPPGTKVTKVVGPSAGAISSDTVAQGDFDGDGFDDLLIGSPHGNPQGRVGAGAMHFFYGRPGRWPKVVDLADGALPPQVSFRVAEIQGALGTDPGPPFDQGDTLCYSAAAGDLDGDGRDDIITNEMIGNGIGPGSIDAGNLVVLPGAFVSPPRFGLGAGAPSP